MSLFSAFKSRFAKHAVVAVSRTRAYSSQAASGFPLQNYSLLLLLAGGGGFVAYAESNSSKDTTINEGWKDPNKKKVVVLGTGWAGTTFLRNVDSTKYNIQVVSPRNYFTFTPLLPSVTNGSVEPRSIAEPIRRIVENKVDQVKYLEAECLDIDANEKKIACKARSDLVPKGKENFTLDYDYLVIAVGARPNTFNIPGVVENCHFLKEIEDAQRIRKNIVDNFERANLPSLTEEEKKQILHFVVVGGGPAGVEFAAELHDYVYEDLLKLYPNLKDFVKITLIEAADHILNMFDQRITKFAEEKFHRDGINLKTGCLVNQVTADCIRMKSNGELVSMPYGMIVWSTGIGTLPVISQFMKNIGQNGRRVLATDEWLRVKGCDNVYALGDCASIDQRKLVEDIAYLFKMADKDNSGTLTVEKFSGVFKDIKERYPQINIYMKKKGMKDVRKLLEDAEKSEEAKKIELNIEQFKGALSAVDSQMKALPATAQVAAQQGYYLAKCYNDMEKRELDPEGPVRVRGEGRHRFRPFQYKHFGQFAPLGGEQTAAELPGDWVSIGKSTQWLWYSVYASKQISWRTRALVVFDWTKKFVFGRDSSRM